MVGSVIRILGVLAAIFGSIFIFGTIAGGYLDNKVGSTKTAEEETRATYDYAIIHIHEDGSPTPWIADEKPYFSDGFIHFTAKGIDVPVILSGDLTVIRIGEGASIGPGPSEPVGPARQTYGVLPMVAME